MNDTQEPKKPIDFDALFADDAPVEAFTGDILTLTIPDFCALTQGQTSGLKFRAIQTTDIKTVSSLRRRIAEYVHWNSLNARPTRLGDVNRRFGRLAKQLGTSSSDVIMDLVTRENLIEFDRGGITAVYSKAVFAENTEAIKMTNEPVYKLIERLFANMHMNE